MVTLTHASGWAFTLTYSQIFILWCMNHVADELENPLNGKCENKCSIDLRRFQFEHNDRLLSLVSKRTRRIPTVIDFDTHKEKDGGSRRVSTIAHATEGQISQTTDGSFECLTSIVAGNADDLDDDPKP